MLVTLNASATDPGDWIQQVIEAKLWGKQVAQSFWDILGRRLSDPEQGQLKLLDVLLHARNQQFRAFPIKTIHSGECQQQLGLIDRLLIDGQSLNWQILDKDVKGKIVKDSALTDCYYANGKPIRIEDDGLLTIALNQDDTANFLEKDVIMRIQLDVDGGMTDIVKLLQTRGAQVNPPAKHSLVERPANVSVSEAAKPVTSSKRIAARTTSAEPREIQPSRADSQKSSHQAKTTVLSFHKQASKQDQVPAAAKGVDEAIENPLQAKCGTVSSRSMQADHQEDAQKSVSDPQQSQRLLSVSSSTKQHASSNCRNHLSPKIVLADSTHLPPWASGRAPRTYSRSKATKIPKNKRSSAHTEPGEVVNASEGVSMTGNRRHIIEEDNVQNGPRLKKRRTGAYSQGRVLLCLRH